MSGLHAVAKLAGVSKSTVSRVINNEYGVKKSTKAKVLKAIDECGYMANQVARDLKSQKTHLIGVIAPRISSNAVSLGLEGMASVFEKAGKHLLLANSEQNNDKEIEYITRFNQRRVEGILHFATHLDSSLVEAIQASVVPVVLIGQDGSLYNIPSVIHDDLRVGFNAGIRLLNAGAKEIGFIGVNSQDIAVDNDRFQGLQQALIRSNEKLPLFHSRGEFTIESGYQQTKDLLIKWPQLDGLFCATDRIAIGAMKAISEANLKPGVNIKVLGVGNDELGKVCTPSLSTFNYGFQLSGQKSAQMLLELIENKSSEVSKLVLSFEEVSRSSC
ncbi:LacI family DNA-binding transcriptional regulator [Psychromonas sp. 14N.309.X.WAT.B.A12]|uniref:LacI family DNA-binding transcriptional regulator n=1 Tax=unclassified Psychromonas TaxID=2614957 RepID=UPI0025B0FC05|nr:LacI family DNA-binding transcriptional regulator [Psychromonas sp. 14N.309.X.WAT.B.A12]MDN2662920.1 LacI family DNA-binding transcriptional regulator [Psychromonas sp. 14N.309.X.WAT.B.A12]